MDNLREQVELEMKRAWWDILKEEIYSQPPKFEQLINFRRNPSYSLFAGSP